MIFIFSCSFRSCTFGLFIEARVASAVFNKASAALLKLSCLVGFGAALGLGFGFGFGAGGGA